ncbi:NUDIX domain-containing protein [Rheinheimera nanhaiensis]|uniref:Phosphatase NudJ n=1 Tax=Rheinheimera nanhaiensis E407-8 TaxID=562729 RepID=I1DTZ1_9GAMM|nr:NUDIX domain-containing protein [Rheinheimera nanhaiensis]GAB57519.1 phosphatase NudJ [Rheinheimera nanhaiensis E407-8]
MSRAQLHLTVAAIVQFEQKFLLVEETDKVTGQRVLNQPAGHVEQDEDLLSAVKRELFEETGLALEPCAWLGISQLQAANNHRYVRINFVFEPVSLPAQYQPQDSDILALHWLSAQQLAEQALPLRSALVSDAIDLYLQGVRLPLALIQPVR